MLHPAPTDMRIPLEDGFQDILRKAMVGLRLPRAELARRTGVPAERIDAMLEGDPDGEALRRLAPVLALDADALAGIARGDLYPESGDIPAGFRLATVPFGDMTVNSFLLWDGGSREAALFDTGAAGPLLRFAVAEGLRVVKIFITHAHRDHVAGAAEVVRETGAELLTEEREPLAGVAAGVFHEGDRFRVGSLEIEARSTCGHSPGQTTFVVEGLSRPVAVVGDSLFAGSMGGAPLAYAGQLDNTARKILTLPGETLVAPGHGPLSTVAWELAHNPFFAGKPRR